MNLSIRAEDIMTPRRRLLQTKDDAAAERLAADNRFDAVPLLNSDGLVCEFWSQKERRRLSITKRHRVSHDAAVETLLKKLGLHVVQFVFYRSEMVGLVDASDLNRPRACLAWLEPMLELERTILNAVADRNIDERKQAEALGDQATPTIKRQERARKHDLTLPLLEYAQFPSLLKASARLGITNLSDKEIAVLKS